VISRTGSYFGSSYRTERINTYYECQYNVQWTEQLVLIYLISSYAMASLFTPLHLEPRASHLMEF
jgi:hypothetical protein